MNKIKIILKFNKLSHKNIIKHFVSMELIYYINQYKICISLLLKLIIKIHKMKTKN